MNLDYESTKNESELSEKEIAIKEKIKELKKELVEIANTKKSRTLGLKQSITGIMWRVSDRKSGFTLAQIRRHYGESIAEFCRNYEIARESFDNGEMENVDKFFSIYI